MHGERLRVLFLCTGNSARSQIAEALLRDLSKGRILAFSAGTDPRPHVHPTARAVLEERYQIDVSELHPKSVEDFAGQRFDVVITVCDHAAQACPAFPNARLQVHWSLEDPAEIPAGVEQRRAFELVASVLARRLRLWMSLPAIRRTMSETG